MLRWPQSAMVDSRISRTAKSMSALSVTTAALFPPIVRMLRPRRAPTLLCSAFEMTGEPVAQSRGICLLCAKIADSGWSQINSCDRYSGQFAVLRALARRNSVLTANAVRVAFRDGRQMTEFPHASATSAFIAQTRTGKLKEVITATGPSGTHV